MSDTIDMYRDMKEMRRLERERLGVKCPVCIERLPKAHPKVLLHGQVCRAHKPHYRDPRPPRHGRRVQRRDGWNRLDARAASHRLTPSHHRSE